MRPHRRAGRGASLATIDEPYIKNKDDADVETWRKNILWGSLMAGANRINLSNFTSALDANRSNPIKPPKENAVRKIGAPFFSPLVLTCK